MTELSSAWEQLKKRTLPTAEIRQVDHIAVEQYGMNSLVLMENAGIGCSRWLIDRFRIPPRTLILCGRGNNGGDGLVIARQLQVQGWNCSILQLGPVEKLSPDALTNWRILTARPTKNIWVWSNESFASIPLEEIFSANELIVDAMLGTGAKGSPFGTAEILDQAANRSRAFRVAIDVPTGLDADNDTINEPTFRADATLTFVALKPAFGFAHVRAVLGEVTVLPIGIPRSLIESMLS